MNRAIKTSFEIRQFKSSKDKDFISALKIYSRNIPANLRTDTNEITFWLDNYNKVFSDKYLYVFGLYYDDTIVGFSEMVYLKSARIFVIDYLVIEKSYRKNNLFYSFAFSIERFVENEPVQYDYILTEIGFMNNTKEPASESKALIRLLKMGGFDIIKAPYKQPLLGVKNYESQMNAQLMIWTNSTVESLNKNTYMSFVHSIYFEHYLNWYQKFLSEEEFTQYETHLKMLYKKIDKEIRHPLVQVNGYHPDPNAKGTPPSVDVAAKANMKAVRGLAFLTIAIAVTLFGSMKLFSVSISEILPIFIASLVTIIAFMAIYSKNAMKVFSKLGELLKLFSRNSK